MIDPRKWQKAASDTIAISASSGLDRALLYACPGAGKTFAALFIAQAVLRALAKGETQANPAPRLILVLTPSRAIKTQWIDGARKLGLELIPVTKMSQLHQTTLPLGAIGYVLSYQQAIGKFRHSLRFFCEENRPLVILDEVHHTAESREDRDGNVWGLSVQLACKAAAFKLCITGTPFRSGPNPIAFVKYNENNEAVPTFSYPYGTAIRDGVCRPIRFEFYEAQEPIEWRGPDGVTRRAHFEELLDEKPSAQRLRAALAMGPQSWFLTSVLQDAHEELMRIRGAGGVGANAAGIVVALDQEHAEQIAAKLTEISGEPALLVHSRIDDAGDLIERFRDSTERWIVGISMISEGVDIPRLRVGVYATNVREALYFNQFCGRLMRVLEGESFERARVYMPADPVLKGLALKIEEEVYHAIGEVTPVRSTGAGGGKRGERRGIHVISSEAVHKSSVAGGTEWPGDYVRRHEGRVQEFRSKSPSVASKLEDIEILEILVATNQIPPPERTVAAE